MLSLYSRRFTISLLRSRLFTPANFKVVPLTRNIPLTCVTTKWNTTTTTENKISAPKGSIQELVLDSWTHSRESVYELLKDVETKPEARSILEKSLDGVGNTVLHAVVAYCGATELIKVLSISKDHINTKNKNGITPVFVATQQVDPELVNILVANGADLNTSNPSGHTPLHYAATSGSPDVIRTLVTTHKIAVDVASPLGITPLMCVHKPECARTLLELGANVNARANEGQTPLHFVVWKGLVEAMKVLVASGGDLEARDKSDRTVLYKSLLADKFSYETLFSLCELGANVNAVSGMVTPLMVAIIKRNAEAAMLLATRGADVNADINHNGTALHFAAGNGDDAIVSFLLQRGAKFTHSHQKLTPLHEAAKPAHLSTIELLVKGGNPIDARDYADYTPLACAVSLGHVKAVELLAKLGADVNARNIQGRTPLFVASNFEMMATLVKLGAKTDVKDKEGNTPLLSTMRTSEYGRIGPLVKAGANVDQLDDNGYTPLHLAVLCDVVDVIEPIIKAGANVNGVNKDKEPPIHTAASKAKPNVAAELMKFNPDVNAVFRGITALFVVGNPDTVRSLVKAGADINFSTPEEIPHLTKGASPLHAVCALSDAATVRAMVECGANIEAKNSHGHTPLNLACRNSDVRVFRTLVELGANVHHKDNHNNTLLFHACEMGNNEIVLDLLAQGLKWNELNNMMQRPIHAAASSGKVDILLKFTHLGADVNEPDRAGDTPIVYAVNGRSIEMVKKLIELGAVVEPINQMGWSPLVFAGFADATMIPFFVEKGADINRQDNNGNTPLHLAIKHAGNAASVAEFLKAGANPNIKNKQGQLPLDFATQHGLLNIVQVFNEHAK